MRDILFRNMTSEDKKRKAISSCEVSDQEGVHSIIRRHFICLVKEVSPEILGKDKPAPYVYVVKKRDTPGRKENFFCKIKGSIYAVDGERLFLVFFMHSLYIQLAALPLNKA